MWGSVCSLNIVGSCKSVVSLYECVLGTVTTLALVFTVYIFLGWTFGCYIHIFV